MKARIVPLESIGQLEDKSQTIKEEEEEHQQRYYLRK
jgi:hypothetical protein